MYPRLDGAAGDMPVVDVLPLKLVDGHRRADERRRGHEEGEQEPQEEQEVVVHCGSQLLDWQNNHGWRKEARWLEVSATENECALDRDQIKGDSIQNYD